MGKATRKTTIRLFLSISLIGWGLMVLPVLVNANGVAERPATKEEKEF
ncbi:MAG: hypothetical protein GX085_10160 [Firmicutes bacterium]|nr:hypothetical protein [Bacillota bacterium]